MSTWGKMLLFNSEEKQILDLGFKKGKMKIKMRKKNLLEQLWNKQTSKQINRIILNIPA